jgi:dihydrofolate reductase
MNKNLSIIVASTLEYGIGYENKLCWNIPEELKNFKNITSNCLNNNAKNCIIMGKNTWYSLPKAPLQNRINIIISFNDYNKIKNEITDMKDVYVFKNIDEALIYIDNNDVIETAFIIGGSQLYNTFLEKYIKNIKSIYWSIIYGKKYECDRYIASNIIYNNFTFKKEDIIIKDKYISLYGTNKNKLYNIIDEPPD